MFHSKYLTFLKNIVLAGLIYVLESRSGSGEFGPFTIRPSGIFGEFGLLVGEFGPQLENSAN